MNDQKVMSFTEHLAELRLRLKRAVYALLAGVAVAYAFSETLFLLLAQPLIRAWRQAGLGPPRMHFASAIEPFMTYVQVSVIGGLFIASPLIFYELWRFIAPGLYRRERRLALPFAALSALFFIGGAAFGYFVAFPVGFRFFLGFANDNLGSMQQLFGGAVKFSVGSPVELSPMLMMGDYFGLVWRLLLAFGLVFELPLVISFLAIAGLVGHRALWRFNRYFVILSFVIGAALTPPDVVSQVMMSLPLVVLYNLSILVAWIADRRRTRRAQRAADDARPPG